MDSFALLNCALTNVAAFDRAMGNLTRTLGMSERKWRRLLDALDVPRPFDWHRDAFEDYVRGWPPIVGYGRGRPLLAPEVERHLQIEADREYDRIERELAEP